MQAWSAKKANINQTQSIEEKADIFGVHDIGGGRGLTTELLKGNTE